MLPSLPPFSIPSPYLSSCPSFTSYPACLLGPLLWCYHTSQLGLQNGCASIYLHATCDALMYHLAVYAHLGLHSINATCVNLHRQIMPSLQSCMVLHVCYCITLLSQVPSQVEAEGDVATAFTLARILSNIPLSRGGPASVVIFDIHALQVATPQPSCWLPSALHVGPFTPCLYQPGSLSRVCHHNVKPLQQKKRLRVLQQCEVLTVIDSTHKILSMVGFQTSNNMLPARHSIVHLMPPKNSHASIQTHDAAVAFQGSTADQHINIVPLTNRF